MIADFSFPVGRVLHHSVLFGSPEYNFPLNTNRPASYNYMNGNTTG